MHMEAFPHTHPHIVASSAPRDTTSERLMAMLKTAMGPKMAALLEDEEVLELMLNPDGRLWCDRLGKGRADTGHRVGEKDAERIIKLIATGVGCECNETQPILSAELPGTGSRFQGMIPPVTQAPVFTIRKKATLIFTLEDYVRQQILSATQAIFIKEAIRRKQNILVVGGTGTGKTTLVNAILNEVGTLSERIVIIEDTRELQCLAADTVFLRAKEGVATMNDLLKATMRLRPDRIIVGEVRGPEALTLLKAWNTGHPGGVATVHASSAKGGLYRLEQLILEASVTVPKALIAEAVNLIISIEREGFGRKVKEIVEVSGLTHGDYETLTLEC